MKKNYFWLLPFSMAMANYCYYEKMRRTMRTAIVSYLPKEIAQQLKKTYLAITTKIPFINSWREKKPITELSQAYHKKRFGILEKGMEILLYVNQI